MMKTTTREPVRWSTSVAVTLIILIGVWSVQYLMQEWTIVQAHVHDFFIPIVAAYAVEHQGIAHPGLQSPFGIVFFFMASNSYQLIQHSQGWLSLDKIHMLSSLQWLMVMLLLFVALRSLQDPRHRFTLLLLAVLLLISLQPRNFDDADWLPSWYANYNVHLWSLLILQAANHYCWRRSDPAGRKIIWLGVVEAVILVLNFNYKISFFISACGLSLLALWYLPGWRARFAYYGAMLASAGLMTLALAGAGADYGTYLRDLLHAARGKHIAPELLVVQLPVMFIYIAVCGWMDGSPAHSPAGQRGPIALLRRLFAQFGFHAVAGGAICLASLGDFFAPVWPNILLAAWVAASDARSEPRVRPLIVASAAMTWIGLLVFRGVAALHFVAAAENQANADSSYTHSIISAGQQQLRLKFDTGRPSFQDLYASGLFSMPADLPQRQFRYSYRGLGEAPYAYHQMIYETSEEDYPQEVNETADWLRTKGAALKGDLVIADLGFINPWPMLTQNRYPDRWLHWIHPGTTISLAQTQELFATVSTADAVVLPLLKRAAPDDFGLFCAFYLWNLEQGQRFVPQHFAGSNLIFVRRGGKLPVDAQPPIEFDTPDMRTACAERLEKSTEKAP